MRNMTFHDSFTPQSCENDSRKRGKYALPAVTLEAGLTWMDVYAAASLDRDLVRSKFGFKVHQNL